MGISSVVKLQHCLTAHDIQAVLGARAMADKVASLSREAEQDYLFSDY